MLQPFFDRIVYALQMVQRKRRGPQKPHRLAVLGIMKNEAFNIDEWVSHYLWQGCDAIFIIDNGSTDDSVARAKQWSSRANVHIISLNEPWNQKKHYWTAIDAFKIREQFEWLLIADLDEFWFCKDGLKMADAVDGYDQGIDVVYANWTIFGSAGFKEHPASLRQQLTLRQPRLGPHVSRKWLCRTRVLRIVENLKIHTVAGACSSNTITDNETFQINHYVTQSLEFFSTVKMARGDVVDKRADTVRTMEYFHAYDAPCTLPDRNLADQVEHSGLPHTKRTEAA